MIDFFRLYFYITNWHRPVIMKNTPRYTTRTFYVGNYVPVLAISKYSRTLSVFRTLVLALISSVPLPVPNLWKQFRTRRIYVPQNQNSPVPRTFSSPVLRCGYVEGYGIRTRTSGYDPYGFPLWSLSDLYLPSNFFFYFQNLLVLSIFVNPKIFYPPLRELWNAPLWGPIWFSFRLISP